MAGKSIYENPELTRQKTAAESGPYILSPEDQEWIDII